MQNEITRDQIRATFLANGFRVKHGRNDLADYVYQAAFALLELHRARIDELEEQLSAIGAGGVEPLRKAAPDKSDGWHLVSKSTQKRLAAKWGFVPASALDAEREDAECFRFWVSEAARAPGAMAKLITHCTTEQEYREAILPVARKAREAMQAALQRLPSPDYDPRDVAFTAAPQTTEDQSRAAFEAYYSDNYEHETAIIRNAEGSYIFPGAAFAWLTWQAAVEWANSRRPGQRA